MATTKIWKVVNRLDHVLEYAKDREKTSNPVWSDDELNAMYDVMNYAANGAKTEQQFYVTALNCSKYTAREEMQLVKQRFGKTDKILAWHGYQSFAKDEVDADTAHEIGVKLAKALWPEFQVIVATHLNTEHFHNHFVLNSVSFKTGKKFYGSKATYRQMREESDRLCREYGLSVIENKTQAYTQSYAERKAEREGKPTWRTAIRQDVDKAIAKSISFNAFLRTLQDMGYEIKTDVKYIAVKAKGMERFARLRSLGDDYTEEAIKHRILRQQQTERPQKAPEIKRVRFVGSFLRCRKITWNSIRGLYYYYLRKLRKAKTDNSAAYVLREDLRIMGKLSAQAKFLNKYKIDDMAGLAAHKEQAEAQMKELCIRRNKLRNEERHVNIDENDKSDIKDKIAALSVEIRGLRREMYICSEIEERSKMLQEKIKQIKEIQREELNKDASRRRGGTGRQYVNARR